MPNLSSLSDSLPSLPSLSELLQEKVRRSINESAKGGVDEVRARCKTLAGFVREAWHVIEPGAVYIHGWHIDAICAHLEAITWGKFLAMGLDNRLLINVPPGTMKSLLVSVFWPAWEWGPAGMPHLRYLTSSYSERFARRDSRKHRDLVQSDWYQAIFPNVKIVRDGEMSFSNTAGGARDAAPFSSLTGGRGDRVIIDDPHSTETAESDAERETTERIFRESVATRLNDTHTSAIVIIMQRLHEKDISGTIKRLGLPYQHVMLPMEFEPERQCVTAIFTDPRERDGELLFPERFPPAAVARDKAAMGSYAVAGQYQQRPAPRGGLTFRRSWFGTVKAAPADTKWVRGWDLAASTTDGSAFTAGVKLGKDREGRFYVGHVIREQATGAGVRRMILNTADTDGRHVEISIPQDPGQAGKVQAMDFVALLAGFKAYTSPESGDKISRADPIAAQAEAGNVSLVEGPWNEAFLDELETFPTGKFKDQVDALSRAFGRLVGMPKVRSVSPILVLGVKTSFGDHPGMG